MAWQLGTYRYDDGRERTAIAVRSTQIAVNVKTRVQKIVRRTRLDPTTLEEVLDDAGAPIFDEALEEEEQIDLALAPAVDLVVEVEPEDRKRGAGAGDFARGFLTMTGVQIDPKGGPGRWQPMPDRGATLRRDELEEERPTFDEDA